MVQMLSVPLVQARCSLIGQQPHLLQRLTELLSRGVEAAAEVVDDAIGIGEACFEPSGFRALDFKEQAHIGRCSTYARFRIRLGDTYGATYGVDPGQLGGVDLPRASHLVTRCGELAVLDRAQQRRAVAPDNDGGFRQCVGHAHPQAPLGIAYAVTYAGGEQADDHRGDSPDATCGGSAPASGGCPTGRSTLLPN